MPGRCGRGARAAQAACSPAAAGSLSDDGAEDRSCAVARALVCERRKKQKRREGGGSGRSSCIYGQRRLGFGIVCAHDPTRRLSLSWLVQPHKPHEAEPPATGAHDRAVTAGDRALVGFNHSGGNCSDGTAPASTAALRSEWSFKAQESKRHPAWVASTCPADRKSPRLNSSHSGESRMPSSA